MKPINGTGNMIRWSDMPDNDCIAALMYLYRVHMQKQEGETRHIGFTSFDASVMCEIAERIQMNTPITERQLSLMKFKLNGYWKQLRDIDLTPYGTHWSLIRYETAAPASSWRKCSLIDDETLKLEFDYDTSLISRIKKLSGRQFHKKGAEKYWTVPTSRLNLRQVMNMGFELPATLKAELKDTGRTFDYSGLLMQLRPYQIAGANRLAGELKLNGLLADEMGLGKSAQALAALWARRDIAFPALIVCPGSLKYNWAREAHMWLPDISVRILNGRCNRKQFRCRNEYELTVINYDILADRGANGSTTVQKGWGSILQETGFKTVIFDECHKIKNQKAKRTVSIMLMCANIKNRIALSGTPIENRPIEFFTTLKLVAPKLFPNYWVYGTRYCGGISENAFGTKFTGASNTQELNDILTENCMIRRRKSDVLTELPPKQRQVIPVQIDMNQYRKNEEALVSFLQASSGATGSDMSNTLAKIERCKQAAVLGKMKQAQEFIENYLESGNKLVVFATHTFTLDALEGAFPGQSVRIDGSTPMNKRQGLVDKFQNDKNCRLFLGNIKAAGVGLTLTAASDTLTLELSWTPGEHIQAEDRVHRIGQQASSVMAYYMVAQGTIEEKIMELLDDKRKVLGQVLDGEEINQNSLLSELIKQYTPKQTGVNDAKSRSDCA